MGEIYARIGIWMLTNYIFCYRNRPDAEGVVNHPWLDVGHQLHQQSDQISFPAVEFLNLVHRLDKLKEEMLKVESVTW